VKDVMIDLETFGLRAGCALRSVGAVDFDPLSDRVGDSFYVNVDRRSCEDVGLHINLDTVAWWDRQGKKAQDALSVNPVPLRDVLRLLSAFWSKVGGQHPWSQGANYDQPILEEAYRLCGMEAPWKFYNSCCTRTAYKMAGLNFNRVPRDASLVAHSARDDCIHQIRCVQKAHRMLNLKQGEQA
jgi:3' exoribonuclease, RNase T-like